MLTQLELDSVEEMLVRELHGFIKKGELNNGEEADALKDVLECLKSVHHLRSGMAK